MLALANYMVAINKRDNAQSLFEQFLARHPFDTPVRIHLAQIYEATGNGAKITLLLQQLNELVGKNEKNPQALLALAEFRLAAGDAPAAVDLSTKALGYANDRQSRVSASSTLGKARWQLGDVKGTLAVLAPVIDQLVDESALLDLGWAYAASKKPVEARVVGDKLRTTEIATSRSNEFIGWSFYLTGDFALAEQLLKRAAYSSDAIKGYRVGMAIYRQGPTRYTDARAYLLQAAAISGPPALFADAKSEVTDALQAISTAEAAPAAPAPAAPTSEVPTAPAAPDSSSPAPAPVPATAPETPATTAPAPATPDNASPTDPVSAGMARWAADDVKGTIELLGPLGDKIDNEQALVALAWAYVADNRLSDATTVAAHLKGLATKTDAQDELQGWVLYLSGDYRGAEEALKKATFTDPMIKAYRVGMALFMQGQPRYVEARALLTTGQNVSGRKSLLGSAKGEAEQALAAINAASH